MKRWIKLAVLAAALVCAVSAASHQRTHHRAAKPKSEASPVATAGSAEPAGFADAIRADNLGVALMNRHEFDRALGQFQTACVMNSQSDTGCVNMGIALLATKRYEDAARVLATSAERNPRDARTWFNLGLLQKTLGEPDVALVDFQRAAALDPDDADAHYFLGVIYLNQKQDDKSAAEFRKAIELDPFHVSAELGLAQVAERAADAASAQAHRARAERLIAEHLGQPIGEAYGEQGRNALAGEMLAPAGSAAPPIPVRFVDVTRVSGLPSEREVARPASQTQKHRAGVGLAGVGAEEAAGEPNFTEGAAESPLAGFLGNGACVFDYDGDGRPDIFLADADGRGHAALYRNIGRGKFGDVTKAAKLEIRGALGCAAGDYDNDGHPDLAVSSADGLRLFHNEGNGTFRDVTDAAGIRSGGLLLGLTFFDYDHDGDLDLYITRFSDFPLEDPKEPFQFPEDAATAGNMLWRNKGDGTFVDLTSALGLAGRAPSIGALASDLRYSSGSLRRLDLVVTGWQKSPVIFRNAREGAFVPTFPWAEEVPGPAAGVVALDFDQDGFMDLAFTHWAPPGLSIWRNVAGESFERVALTDPGWMRGWGIATLDFDNDGRVDLVALGENFSGEGRILLLRNEGSAGFRDVTHETRLDQIVLRDPRAVIPFDFDGDGSTDLLITQNHLPPVLLKNVGGNKNSWLELTLRGDADNRLGLGARVDVFSGARKQIVEISGGTSYLGQGPPEIHLGLGATGEADIVRAIWPDGLVQDELEVPADKRTEVTQPDAYTPPR